MQYCVDMCRRLCAAGVPGFHFYTLNLERSVLTVLEELGAREHTAARRALPWRGSRQGSGLSLSSSGSSPALAAAGGGGSSSSSSGSSSSGSSGSNGTGSGGDDGNSPKTSTQRAASGSGCPSSRSEEVRPINWANRPKSYIKRTHTWDEFPNGRWGDGRSPAFGELSDSHFFRPVEGSKEDRLAMWGEAPITPEDVSEVFARYVEGKIPILPWSESAPQAETRVISSALAAINRAGFWTINSQPAVNGERSDHAVYGWGGAGGRVYQRAYIEFFVSPRRLELLLAVIRQYPGLQLSAVDSAGHATNSSKGVTALTWGAFPNREIVQPTIFEPDTFLVWAQEAFQLWTAAWAALYDDETESSALLYEVRGGCGLQAGQRGAESGGK